jgi:hypothetical protein
MNIFDYLPFTPTGLLTGAGVIVVTLPLALYLCKDDIRELRNRRKIEKHEPISPDGQLCLDFMKDYARYL